jgi:DNA invertase Pin-like site-specific DNA recombinase
MLVGYCRVSTQDQNLTGQFEMLRSARCEKIFSEKVSGVKTDRAELAKVLKALQPGDVLVVCRLDRLARSTRDLLNILHTLGERQIGFKSLKDGWADTTTPHGRLMLTVLGGLAEFERELIRSRTSEGRKRAIERGVKFGRKSKLTPFQMQEALERLAKGDTQAMIAKSYGVDQTTISALKIRTEMAAAG